MKQAWRHLWRNRRRSILTLVAVFLPVLILVLELGLLNGEQESLFKNTVTFETGHFQVRSSIERADGGALSLMKDPATALAVVDSVPGVAWRTERLDLPAMISNGGRSQGVVLQGVIPEEVGRVSPIGRLISQGAYLSSGGRGVVIGVELRDLLATSVGGELVLLGVHPDTGIGAASVPVVGVYVAPDPAMGRGVVQVDLGLAQTLARRPGAVTSIVGFVDGVEGPWDQAKVEKVVADLRARLPKDYKVLDYNELAPELRTFQTVEKPFHVLVMSIFFILGGLVVLNTLFLSVVERTHELGVILALGSSRRHVMRMVMTEALLLALLGAAVGLAVGGGLVAWAHAAGGVQMPGSYSEAMRLMNMEPVLQLRVSILEYLASGLAMVGVALLAAWIPARRAAALEPVEAMRHVD